MLRSDCRLARRPHSGDSTTIEVHLLHTRARRTAFSLNQYGKTLMCIRRIEYTRLFAKAPSETLARVLRETCLFVVCLPRNMALLG